MKKVRKNKWNEIKNKIKNEMKFKKEENLKEEIFKREKIREVNKFFCQNRYVLMPKICFKYVLWSEEIIKYCIRKTIASKFF